MKCGKCKKDYPSDYNFCPECGARLEEEDEESFITS